MKVKIDNEEIVSVEANHKEIKAVAKMLNALGKVIDK